MLDRRWASVNTGALRFSREGFEAVTLNLAIGVPPEFRLQHIICAIGLRVIDDVFADRMRHQIG
jgi:hypothetical protein